MDYFEQAIFLWLSFHSNQEGSCFPSIHTLALETRMSRPQVFRKLKSLEDKKMIKRSKAHGEVNVYHIIIADAPPVSTRDGGSISQRRVPVSTRDTELNSGKLNKITKEPASLLKDFKPDYTILKSTDPAWEDVVTYYRKAGKKAYIQGDKASFYDGEWHVFGNQGWVSTSLSVRENIVFK